MLHNYTIRRISGMKSKIEQMKVLDEALAFLNEEAGDDREDIIGHVGIKVFGRTYNIEIGTNRWKGQYANVSYTQQIQAVNKLAKLVTDISLYNYLYNHDKEWYTEEINDDPYYDGKKINSGMDLMKSIDWGHKNTMFMVDPKTKVIYFCGEYWVDEEHGFSIYFPNGKFVKGKPGERVVDEHWVPIYTGMGQYADSF